MTNRKCPYCGSYGEDAIDTDVGHEITIPVKRDEHGPVSEKSVKELFLKIEEERLELIAALATTGIGIDVAAGEYYPGSYIFREEIANEWADTITALTTLADAIGIDADERAAAIARCNRRNLDRGRL